MVRSVPADPRDDADVAQDAGSGGGVTLRDLSLRGAPTVLVSAELEFDESEDAPMHASFGGVTRAPARGCGPKNAGGDAREDPGGPISPEAYYSGVRSLYAAVVPGAVERRPLEGVPAGRRPFYATTLRPTLEVNVAETGSPGPGASAGPRAVFSQRACPNCEQAGLVPWCVNESSVTAAPCDGRDCTDPTCFYSECGCWDQSSTPPPSPGLTDDRWTWGSYQDAREEGYCRLCQGANLVHWCVKP